MEQGGPPDPSWDVQRLLEVLALNDQLPAYVSTAGSQQARGQIDN